MRGVGTIAITNQINWDPTNNTLIPETTSWQFYVLLVSEWEGQEQGAGIGAAMATRLVPHGTATTLLPADNRARQPAKFYERGGA